MSATAGEHAIGAHSRFIPRNACLMCSPLSNPMALSLATTTATSQPAFGSRRKKPTSSLSFALCMALAVNHLPAMMELSWKMALSSTMAVMTAGATNITPSNPLK